MDSENENGMSFDEERDVLNVLEAADFLRCSVSAVYRDTALGHMPHIHNGRRLLFLRTDFCWRGFRANGRGCAEHDVQQGKYT